MVVYISFKNSKCLNFIIIVIILTWEVGTTFTGNQTFLLATSIFEIPGALCITLTFVNYRYHFVIFPELRNFMAFLEIV